MTNQDFLYSISLPGEEWRDVVGFEGLYSVSSEGRVASMRAKRIMNQTPQTHRGRTYMHVCLYQNHTPKKVRVHRLVATAFLHREDNEMEVDHINNDPLDNSADNLKWCSHQENMRNPHTRESEREYKLKNPFHPDKSTFFNRHEESMKAVVQIENRRVVARYNSIGEAAASTGYNKVSISAACNHRLKTYKQFEWAFESDYESQVSMSKN